MQGVYKITNKINGHAYIGISNDINKRFNEHKNRFSIIDSKEYDKALYKAFRKYGIDNFIFEVLIEENDIEKRKELEKYYIKLYNTYNNGYNETIGGDIAEMQHGETHSRAKLTEQDVINIREAYNNHERYNEVYERYKNRIGLSGFHKI